VVIESALKPLSVKRPWLREPLKLAPFNPCMSTLETNLNSASKQYNPRDSKAQKETEHFIGDSLCAMEESYDVLIVGAGVLGCAAAVTFARQGRKVLLLERDLREPDRIVGELLQPGGVAALEKLGMGECLEGIDARPVKGYEIFYRGEKITFWYPPVEVKNDSIRSGGANEKMDRELNGQARPVTKRRPEGRSFHHGKFVMKLRDAAKREEGIQVVQTTVKSLIKCEKSEQVIGVVCSTKGAHEQRVFDILISSLCSV
jgi:squalene monooxygenase